MILQRIAKRKSWRNKDTDGPVTEESGRSIEKTVKFVIKSLETFGFLIDDFFSSIGPDGTFELFQ